MPTKLELETRIAELEKTLSRPNAGRPPKPRCKCGEHPDTARSRRKFPRHKCWAKNKLPKNELAVDVN